MPRFGLYTLRADLALEGEAPRTETLTLARVPPYPDLSDAEKRASPYGLNVHGGSDKHVIEPFRKAGVLWYRDYAFTYEWMLRAKGDDRRYGGWPWYPALVKRYTDAGVMLLPCLMKAIGPVAVKDGKAAGPVGPDRAWVREIADIVLAFPQITYWELDNEYDLPKEHAEAEAVLGWANYRAYHRRFADVLDVLGAGALVAVEQGRAGIWPDRIRACVESGDFRNIGVVNTHHYCGTDPPDSNYGNWNTGFEGDHRAQAPILFFDALRETKRAAVSDGQPRESWLTEFGWDNLAGPVVSLEEQAAYLARAWMIALAADTDKCFWFYDYDAPQPKQIFDGMGLLAADGSPKLALCALAGLTSALPAPKCLGSIEAGEGTAGFIFESRGELVAALWTLTGDAGPEVTFKAREIRDALGNPLPGKTARLGMAPVYALGLDKADPLFAQTAYDLATPHLVVAAAGDSVTVTLDVSNRRDAGLDCTVRLALPEGWTSDRPEEGARVGPGETKALTLPLTVAPQEPLGVREAGLTVSEGGRTVKRVGLRVLVRPPLAMQVGPMTGPPGETAVTVKVVNRTSKVIPRATLVPHLPASWEPRTIDVHLADLRPGEVREVKCEFLWNTAWKPGERASVTLDAGDGRTLTRPIIPNRCVLRRAKGLEVDGRLDDWPADSALPDWLLGATTDEAGARVRLAWAPEGLYGAAEVKDATLRHKDPRSFWAGDCLELFIDTGDDKRHREYEPGDHQFWFVPLVEENRVYVGQWKRKGEVPETRYDLPGLKTAARRDGDGYVMEFLLPASLLQKYRPQAGASLGLDVNLTVQGRQFSRQVYWPAVKNWFVENWPKMWGSAELAE